jgi:hypothetical protein
LPLASDFVGIRAAFDDLSAEGAVLLRQLRQPFLGALRMRAENGLSRAVTLVDLSRLSPVNRKLVPRGSFTLYSHYSTGLGLLGGID